MRKQIVAGNWKMNCDIEQTQALLDGLKQKDLSSAIEVIVAPPFTNLSLAVHTLEGSDISVAAQNMHQMASGAFTGEVSAAMLKSVGVRTVILGHSERRAYFWETNALLAEKVNAAIADDLTLIFCFGEELEDRQANAHFNVVKQQLEEGLFHISSENWSQVVLAYEPVWAIGTGETATPEQAQEMHGFIRAEIADKFGAEIANEVTILYGGSVKPGNAKEIFGKPDVDGGLIGGASLKADDFASIVNAFDN
ncbi:MAG: triose-phosphate isomerase [Bacteroidota bacterium]